MTEMHTSDLDDLKGRVDARDVALAFLGQGKRLGNSIRYPSPLRNDGKRDSFHVYANGFKDFGGSGESGDVVKLVMLLRRCDFKEAVDYLRGFPGMPSAPGFQAQRLSEAHYEPPDSEWQRVMQMVLEDSESFLWSEFPAAVLTRDYLRRFRYLGDDTIKRFRLGYSSGHWRLPWKNNDDKQARLHAGIVIPVFVDDVLWALRVRQHTGDLARLLGRVSADDKYLNVLGSHLSGTLFNASAIAPGKDVLFVEGEFDAMLGQQELGDNVAVVTLGPASNRLASRWKARLQEAGNIYLALDNDEAGKEAAMALDAALPKAARILRFPMGKDLTEFYARPFRQGIRDWFESQRGGGEGL